MNHKILLTMMVIKLFGFDALYAAEEKEYELVTKKDFSNLINLNQDLKEYKTPLIKIDGKELPLLEAVNRTYTITTGLASMTPLDYCLKPNADPVMRILIVDAGAEKLKWSLLCKISIHGLRNLIKNNYVLIDSDEELALRKIPGVLVLGTKDRPFSQKLLAYLKMDQKFLKAFPENFDYSCLKKDPELYEADNESLLQQAPSHEGKKRFRIGDSEYSIAEFSCLARALNDQEFTQFSCLKKVFYTTTIVLRWLFERKPFKRAIFASLCDLNLKNQARLVDEKNFVFLPASGQAQKLGVSGLLVIKIREYEEDTDEVVHALAEFGNSVLHHVLNKNGNLDTKPNCYH